MYDLKPCPFCGGKGKISFKNYRFVGQNHFGDKKLKYRVQVICNRCKSRGKPVITDALINPDPYRTKWWDGVTVETAKRLKQQEMFAPYVKEAIEAWNRRAKNDSKHTASD